MLEALLLFAFITFIIYQHQKLLGRHGDGTVIGFLNRESRWNDYGHIMFQTILTTQALTYLPVDYAAIPGVIAFLVIEFIVQKSKLNKDFVFDMITHLSGILIAYLLYFNFTIKFIGGKL